MTDPIQTEPAADAHAAVRTYYGDVIRKKEDLQTSACCTAKGFRADLKPLLANIDAEIQGTFYGCGAEVPQNVAGAHVLDLGCGTGQDAYLLAQLVGPDGFVTGVDMTPEQLAIARRHVDGHMARFGYARPNVAFKHGYIEDLAAAGVAAASVDVVVSNCVLNLSPDKPRVFAEIARVLKPGGELLFSDVFADRALDPALMRDPVLLGECLAGALHEPSLRAMLGELGFEAVAVVSDTPFEVHSEAIRARLGDALFTSKTIQAFRGAGA